MEESTLRHLLTLQVELIADPELKSVVYTALKKVPDAFWKRESSKKYHPADERGINGNLIHTIKVAKLAKRILSTTTYSKIEEDHLIAGAILHDCMRHGTEGTAMYSVEDHPQLVRQFLEEECEIEMTPEVEGLCALIENHMGKWGKPPYNFSLPLSSILHIADYIASQTDIEVKL